jgi:hypothetical protein
LNSSVNRRRGRRLRVFGIADIVPTFREMSTKPDQVHTRSYSSMTPPSFPTPSSTLSVCCVAKVVAESFRGSFGYGPDVGLEHTNPLMRKRIRCASLVEFLFFARTRDQYVRDVDGRCRYRLPVERPRPEHSRLVLKSGSAVAAHGGLTSRSLATSLSGISTSGTSSSRSRGSESNMASVVHREPDRVF